jgi:hypothetical protein
MSPVALESGKLRVATFRRACDKRLRVAVATLADSTRHWHPWAKEVYARARARGQDHPHAIRTLGRAWIRVLWRCWHDRVPYDPARHGNFCRVRPVGGWHRTSHEGTILEGTKTDHGEEGAGRVVPVPATLAWMLEAQINLNGPNCALIFTTPGGRMWRERNFYRDVWKPTQEAAGVDIRPHECRHSYITHLQATGINVADLAEIAGHRVETMLAQYTHALRTSFSSIRQAVS